MRASSKGFASKIFHQSNLNELSLSRGPDLVFRLGQAGEAHFFSVLANGGDNVEGQA